MELAACVGGQGAVVAALVRRALLSRRLPEVADELGVAHVRGVLLYGPPGC